MARDGVLLEVLDELIGEDYGERPLETVAEAVNREMTDALRHTGWMEEENGAQT